MVWLWLEDRHLFRKKWQSLRKVNCRDSVPSAVDDHTNGQLRLVEDWIIETS